MLNFASSRDPERARELKDLYKGVLAALVTAIEEGIGEAPPDSVTWTFHGRPFRWELSEGEASPCPSCCSDRLRYEPDDDGMPFDFCPACWSMDGGEGEAQGSFNVTKSLEKSVRDLPPGLTMKMKVGEDRLPVSPPVTPTSDEEHRKALGAYGRAAGPRLEIGRQVWMARMAFEGMNRVPQDYGEARRWFERAARWGHGEALSTLGLMALHGLGEPVDHAKTAELCRNAADRGYARAETGMGRLCWDGNVVPQDRAAAVAWWRRAVRKHDSEAQLWLGRALICGGGVERDAKEGLALVREAAGAGYPDAQFFLGTVLLDGRAGPMDEAEAVSWLKKAAGQGHEGAKDVLEDLGPEGEDPRQSRT